MYWEHVIQEAWCKAVHSGKQNKQNYPCLSLKEHTDGEARAQKTNTRLSWRKGGASVLWRVQREAREQSDRGIQESFVRGWTL